MAIGISTYLAYDSSLQSIKNEESQKPESSESAQPVDNTQSGIPKDTSSEEESSAEQANNFVRSTAKRVMPVDGEIIWEYSNGELVKSETLGVWKTHDGMDIAAVILKDGTKGHGLLTANINRGHDKDYHIVKDFIPDSELKK